SRQVEPPLTDGTSPLERKLAFVAEVHLKCAAIVLACARHDRLCAAEDVCKSRVVCAAARIAIRAGDRGGSNRALQEREPGLDTRVRADDARYAQGDRAQPPEVVTRTAEVKDLFGDGECAGASRPELEQALRAYLQEAHVLGELVLSPVELDVRHLHALDVLVELLAGEQALLASEVAELDVRETWVAELLLQRALGLARDVERELEGLAIEPLHLALHPRVEGLVRHLALEKRLDLLRLLDLHLVVVPLALRHRLAYLRSAQLLVELRELACGDVALELVVSLAIGVAPDLLCFTRRITELLGDDERYVSAILGNRGKLFSCRYIHIDTDSPEMRSDFCFW